MHDHKRSSTAWERVVDLFLLLIHCKINFTQSGDFEIVPRNTIYAHSALTAEQEALGESV